MSEKQQYSAVAVKDQIEIPYLGAFAREYNNINAKHHINSLFSNKLFCAKCREDINIESSNMSFYSNYKTYTLEDYLCLNCSNEYLNQKFPEPHSLHNFCKREFNSTESITYPSVLYMIEKFLNNVHISEEEKDDLKKSSFYKNYVENKENITKEKIKNYIDYELYMCAICINNFYSYVKINPNILSDMRQYYMYKILLKSDYSGFNNFLLNRGIFDLPKKNNIDEYIKLLFKVFRERRDADFREKKYNR